MFPFGQHLEDRMWIGFRQLLLATILSRYGRPDFALTLTGIEAATCS